MALINHLEAVPERVRHVWCTTDPHSVFLCVGLLQLWTIWSAARWEYFQTWRCGAFLYSPNPQKT